MSEKSRPTKSSAARVATPAPVAAAVRLKTPTRPSTEAKAPAISDAHHDHGPHAPARPFDVRPDTLERASGFFRALGDPQRLRLLGHLLAGERCVTDLAGVFDEGLSTISQRLRVLRAERLVHRRRDGKHIYYALADDHVRDLLQSALAHASEKHQAHDDED